MAKGSEVSKEGSVTVVTQTEDSLKSPNPENLENLNQVNQVNQENLDHQKNLNLNQKTLVMEVNPCLE